MRARSSISSKLIAVLVVLVVLTGTASALVYRQPGGGGVGWLADLLDIGTVTYDSGKVLVADDTDFDAAYLLLAQLGNVTLTSPVDDHVLTYDTGVWVNKAIVEAMISDLLHDAVKMQGVDIDSASPNHGEFYRYDSSLLKFALSNLINAWMMADIYIQPGTRPNDDDIPRFDYASGYWKFEGLPGDSLDTMLKVGDGANPGYDTNSDGYIDTAHGGLGIALVDPGMNKLTCWNDTTNRIAFVNLGTNLTLTGNPVVLNAAITPPGSDTWVLFNDGGATGADSGLTFDKSSKILTVGNQVKLYNGTYYLILDANSGMSATLTFTFPSGYGTSGQAMITDGAGNLSFADISDMFISTWDTDVNDAIDSSNGGTNKTSWTSLCIPWLSGANTWSEIAIGTAKQYLRVNAGATGYEWDTLNIFKNINTASGNYVLSDNEDDVVNFNASDHIDVTGFSDTDSIIWTLKAALNYAGTGLWDFVAGALKIPSSASPTLDAEGKISIENDRKGLGIHDGTGVKYLPLGKSISMTITSPDLLDDKATQACWTNHTGYTFNITEIRARAKGDSCDVTLKENTSETDLTALTTIEAFDIADAGTGVYYKWITSGIDHATIETGNTVIANFTDTANDTPDWVTIVLKGYWS